MAASVTAIADAVAALVKPVVEASPLADKGSQVKRLWVPRRDKDDMGRVLYVDVVARGEARGRELLARMPVWRRHPQVDVCVQRLVETREETDALAAFAEGLTDFLAKTPPAGVGVAYAREIEVLLGDEQHLDEMGLFTAVIQLIYVEGRT